MPGFKCWAHFYSSSALGMYSCRRRCLIRSEPGTNILMHRGIVNTFGVFQSYYASTYLEGFSASSITWIGTVQGFLLINVGVLSGPLYDLGYLRALIGAGTALI